MKSPRTIRFQLFVAVNAAIAMLFVVFLAFDYRREIAERVAEKHVALEEEAKTLLPAVSRIRPQGIQAVQAYVDEVCGQMQEAFSPGHHIAVLLGGTSLQAVAHHRASPEILQAMQAAAQSPTHRAKCGDEELAVGSTRQGDLVVYVSEYLTSIRHTARSQILWRLARIVLLAVVAAVVINLVFLRLAAKPLGQLVDTVHRIGEGELGARTGPFSSAEFADLANAVNSMSLSLAEAERHRRHEMARARQIQEQLLPQETDFPAFAVAHLYQPAEQVAGDYYDIVGLSDGSWLVCIADVTGHGVPAALSAVMIKAFLLHATEHHTDPSQILAFINHRLATVCPTQNLASMFLARFDPQAMILEYASAGHEIGFLLQTDGALRELPATGLPLAVQEEGIWETESLRVGIGDRLLLVTDGVTEAFSPEGELFGRKRLAHEVAQCRHTPIHEVVRRIDAALTAHRQGKTPADDVTVAVVEFRASAT